MRKKAAGRFSTCDSPFFDAQCRYINKKIKILGGITGIIWNTSCMTNQGVSV